MTKLPFITPISDVNRWRFLVVAILFNGLVGQREVTQCNIAARGLCEMAGKTQIVNEYARMWPREVFMLTIVPSIQLLGFPQKA